MTGGRGGSDFIWDLSRGRVKREIGPDELPDGESARKGKDGNDGRMKRRREHG